VRKKKNCSVLTNNFNLNICLYFYQAFVVLRNCHLYENKTINVLKIHHCMALCMLSYKFLIMD